MSDTDRIPEIYIDGLVGIGFVGGMVRCELGTMSLTEKEEDGRPKLEAYERIIMSPQAFLQMYGMIQNLVDKLEESGVVTRNEQPDADQDSATH